MRISDWSSDVCSSDLFDAIVEVVDLAGIQLGIAPRYSTTNIIDAVRIEIVVAARIVDRAQAADQCQIVGEMHAELKLAAQDLIVERVVDTANRTAGIVRAGNAAYARRVRIRSKQCRHWNRRPRAGRWQCDAEPRSEEHTSELQSL